MTGRVALAAAEALSVFGIVGLWTYAYLIARSYPSHLAATAAVAALFAGLAGLARARTFGPALRAFRKTVVVCLLLLAPVTQLMLGLRSQWSRSDYERDGPVYWLASERIRDGRALYVPVPKGPHVFGGNPDWYLYPPFLAATIAILPRAELPVYNRWWLALMAAATWLYAGCLARISSGRVTCVGTLRWGMAIALWPWAIGIGLFGNAEPLLWTCTGLAFAFPLLRGFGLMSAALVKPFAIWPLAVALVRDTKRVAASAAVAVTGVLGIAVLALGVAGFVEACGDWFRLILPNLGQGQFQTTTFFGSRLFGWMVNGNVSLAFAPLNIAHHAFGWTPAPGNLPGATRLYLSATGIAAPLLAAWYFRRQSLRLQCAVTFAAALLFAPIFRVAYGVALFVPAAILIYERRAQNQRGASWPFQRSREFVAADSRP